MTTLGRARIVASARVPETDPVAPAPALPMLAPDRHRRIVREEARAREATAEILARAQADATEIVAAARRAAETVARDAATEARESEVAKLSAVALHIKHADETRAERDLTRSVALAVVLAERMLGSALEQDPALVIKLAQQALAEARGTHQATIDASPLDAGTLEHHLAQVGFDSHAVLVRHDAGLARGSLRISTNLGTLDARLHPQLERLAKALRDTLERG